ncbi:MAG: hypothetical protein D6712_19980 [Chloroflexi bacterium]|nr:MAG: hypothetical protein D6712_19980 [Chloroflexota bacterium]
MSNTKETDDRFRWIEEMIANSPYLSSLDAIGKRNAAVLNSIAESALRFDEIVSRAMDKHGDLSDERRRDD